ncbi:MAG: hypothetical protein OEV52_01230 [Dehalococcoidia bacterium]|nr:hypothetical protein [Dehalococcoidia bacterium]MDH4291341.1 hypothetical protein [Dehalococcoidia bacterium]
MKKTFSLLLAAVLVLGLALTTGSSVMAQPPSEVWVDDDFNSGTPGWNVTRFAVIQDGVTAVAGGGTVHVAAGTYGEQVVINKRLTLQGAGVTTVVKPSAANLTQAFTGLFWSGGTENIAGIIVANVPGGSSVTIRNLKVDESLVTTKPSGADYLAGIFYRETGGLIDTVTVAGTGAWSSSDRAYGIYLSAATNAVSVEITGSRITNVDANGIEVMGNKLTANINHNTITGRGPITDEVQNGVNVGRDVVAMVNYNAISNLVYQPKTSWAAGIIFYHYVSPTGKSATANNNTITNCQVGIIFNNANASAAGNIVNGGTVGLIGIYAEPDAADDWTALFVANTVSGIRDTGSYENAAIGANTYDSGASLEVTIEGNHLAGGGVTDADGISIGVEGADGSIAATITNNTVSGWDYGIRLNGALVDAANSHANDNNISGNDVFGVYNGATGTLNATCNWWGHASGPHHPTANPDGEGDDVSDKVVFTPWVVVPTVTTQPATEVRVYSATLNLNYTVGSCYGPAQVRFAYKKSAGTEWSYTDWVSKTVDGTHAQTLTELDSDIEYHFKAQLEYEETPIEGNTLTFVTSEVPTVTTKAATNITSYSAVVNMSYSAGDLSSVEVRFACKRAADQASFYTSWVSVAGDGTRTEKLTGLASKTNYEYEAQLRYDGTVIEGATQPFTTAPGASIDFYDLFCFVATAAYGTPTAEQIDVLREFRDVVLLESAVGSQFVTLYYQLSPPVANFIVRSDLLRTLVRELLVDPIVWVVEATGDIWRN